MIEDYFSEDDPTKPDYDAGDPFAGMDYDDDEIDDYDNESDDD